MLRLASLSVLALAACGEPARPSAAPAAAEASAPKPAQSSLPTPSDGPRYVGLWAASEEMCADPAWRFKQRSVTTQGEVHCDFTQVSVTPEGYAVEASCQAEGVASQHSMEITLADAGMTVTGGPWEPAPNLTYCGPLLTSE
jgi:hypothetical protein